MTDLTKSLPFVLMMALAAPAFAQTTESTTEGETATETPADTEETPNALELSMGEEAEAEAKIGDIYIDTEHGDWEVRCIKSEAEVDPCQLYQLLGDDTGNPVAEINIFALPGGEGQPAAGATVITPLETLLTQQLAMSVDGGSAKKYPFSWCSQVGCFSRVGMSDGDVAAFKRGVSATLTIVPVAAAEQKVNLKVSLKGFTAGFEDLKSRLPQQ